MRFKIYIILAIFVILLTLGLTISKIVYTSPKDNNKNFDVKLSQKINVEEIKQSSFKVELPPREEEIFSEFNELHSHESEIPNYYSPPLRSLGSSKDLPTEITLSPSTTPKDIEYRYDNAPCTSEFVKNLPSEELVQYLKQKNIGCLRFFWDYDQNIEQALTNENMLAVLDEVGRISQIYIGDNSQGLLQLIFFLRVATYHEFYEPWTFNQNVHDRIEDEVDQLITNPNMNNFNEDASLILNEFLILIDNEGIIYRYVDFTEDIIQTFIEENQRIENYNQRVIIYSIFYAYNRGLYSIGGPLSTQIDGELIEIIKNLALHKELNTYDKVYLINNAIWVLGEITEEPQHNQNGIEALTEILYFYERLSEPYLWTVTAIDRFNNCQTSNPLVRICKEDIIPEVMALAFPNNFNYEDNTINFKTAITKEKTENLYHALKDVDQQFLRLMETSYPVEQDQEFIDLFIYENPEAYRIYQPFLFGLGTNNGGIYIESWGALFTYDRESWQSHYSLEELTRHEYGHYLQGKFLRPGEWFYDPDLLWWEEGGAEFYVGSSNEGIESRKLLAQFVLWDGNNRMSVDDILLRGDQDYRIYTYGGWLNKYFYDNDLEIIFEFNEYIKNNDLASFRLRARQLATDPNLEANFQSYLNLQISNIESLSNPNTIFIGLENLNTGDLSYIEQTFNSQQNIATGECYISSLEELPRFTCRGRLIGNQLNQQEHVVAWDEFNSELNSIYNSLQGSLNNFDELNCRVGKIEFSQTSNNKFLPKTNFYCEGPLGENNYPSPKSVDSVTKDFEFAFPQGTVTCTGQSNILFSSCSVDLDQNNFVELEKIEHKLYESNPRLYYELLNCYSSNPGNLVNQFTCYNIIDIWIYNYQINKYIFNGIDLRANYSEAREYCQNIRGYLAHEGILNQACNSIILRPNNVCYGAGNCVGFVRTADSRRAYYSSGELITEYYMWHDTGTHYQNRRCGLVEYNSCGHTFIKPQNCREEDSFVLGQNRAPFICIKDP